MRVRGIDQYRCSGNIEQLVYALANLVGQAAAHMWKIHGDDRGGGPWSSPTTSACATSGSCAVCARAVRAVQPRSGSPSGGVMSTRAMPASDHAVTGRGRSPTA